MKTGNCLFCIFLEMVLFLNHVFVAVGIANLLCIGFLSCEKQEFKLLKSRQIGYDLNACPAENSKFPVLLPHLDDCSKFYICDSGLAHLKECQPGLHFNSKIKTCDYPRNAGCDKELPKGRQTGDDLSVCPAENVDHPVFLPHPNECNKFYQCDNGLALLKVCPPGLHFNPRDEICDHPMNVGCGKELPKGRQTGDDFSFCPSENLGLPAFLPHPDECNMFYQCDNGLAVLRACPPGLHFNPRDKVCDHPINAGCEELPKGRQTVDDFSFCPSENLDLPASLPHPDECNMFYQCDNGLAVLRACPPGLHFNPRNKVCDHPINAGCDIEMAMASPGVRSPFCPPVNGKTPIFYRHSTNCSVYYMCGNGFEYEFVCPSRLHFNLRKKVCDYEWNSGCENSNN